jgi:hypothetical protein
MILRTKDSSLIATIKKRKKNFFLLACIARRIITCHVACAHTGAHTGTGAGAHTGVAGIYTGTGAGAHTGTGAGAHTGVAGIYTRVGAGINTGAVACNWAGNACFAG